MKCCKYSAGQLKEAVTFQTLTRTSDGAGGFTKAWEPIAGAPARAMVKPMSGRERYASGRIEAKVDCKVVVRYNPDITPGDRVLIRDRPASIEFVANVDFADQWLELDVNLGMAT